LLNNYNNEIQKRPKASFFCHITTQTHKPTPTYQIGVSIDLNANKAPACLLGLLGSSWIFLDLPGSSWIFLDLPGNPTPKHHREGKGRKEGRQGKGSIMDKEREDRE